MKQSLQLGSLTTLATFLVLGLSLNSHADELATAVLLRDTQGGFAGFDGEEITITPSGQWTIHRVAQSTVREQTSAGQVSEVQLATLAGLLEDFETLPAETGQPAANPHQLELSYNGTQLFYYLPTCEPLPERPEQADGGSAKVLLLIWEVRNMVGAN